VPLMSDLGKTDEQKRIMRVLSAPVALGRPYLAPQGIPADRYKELRAAFEATMKDPAFLADAKKLKFDLRPLTGDEVAEIVDDTIDLPPPLIAKAKAAIGDTAEAEAPKK
jgi:tripartite-type tricarboxylate transporter receptor subunit TctC